MPPPSSLFKPATSLLSLDASDPLRDAIEELQHRQRTDVVRLEPLSDFSATYGVRVGIEILLRTFKLSHRESYSLLLDLKCNLQEGMEGNPFAKAMKNVSRGMAVLTVPFTMGFPKIENGRSLRLYFSL